MNFNSSEITVQYSHVLNNNFLVFYHYYYHVLLAPLPISLLKEINRVTRCCDEMLSTKSHTSRY